MEIQQPLGSAQRDLQPDVPRKDRKRPVEQVIVQRLVGHELVHQQPLRATVRLRRAEADEPDEVPVLDNAQEMDLGEPLLVPLDTKQKTEPYESSGAVAYLHGARRCDVASVIPVNT